MKTDRFEEGPPFEVGEIVQHKTRRDLTGKLREGRVERVTRDVVVVLWETGVTERYQRQGMATRHVSQLQSKVAAKLPDS